MALAVLYVAAALLVAVTVLPVLPVARGSIRIWDFPRVQILAGCAVVAALLPAAGGWQAAAVAPAVALALCAAWQLSWIYPYLPGSGVQTRRAARGERAASIRLLVANVEMENRDAEGFLELVARNAPDIVVVDEVDAWWAARLAALLPGFPQATVVPLDNCFGMGVYSALPVLESEVRFLVEPDYPSIHCRVALRSGDTLRLISVHPRPPLPGADSEERDTELVIVAKEVSRDPRPTIVAGDMNDVAWSRTTRRFQAIGGLLDPRRGRGFYATYHARWPAPLRYPLDHLFHSPEFRLLEMRVLRGFGSDHLPLLISLALER